MSFLPLFISIGVAHAIPQQLTQQGRLLDATGAAIDGLHNMSFRIYDSSSGNNILWSEDLSVLFHQGYYSVVLGSDIATNPLEDSVLMQPTLFLEVELNANGPLGPRQAIKSVPFARLSETALNLTGGDVDASQISIAGTMVIDSSGAWVGPTNAVNWSNLQNIPNDIADGDDDLLSAISCGSGQILSWDGNVWGCADDNGLTEAEVEQYVTNDPLDLHMGTTIGGLPILTQGHSDTLGGLSCLDGELAKWDAVLSAWTCSQDNDHDTQLSESQVEAFVINGALDLNGQTTIGGLPIVTEDTQLSESQVESFITNDSLDLAVGTTLGGHNLMTAVQCNAGQILSYDGSDWVCASFQSLLDSDNDGVMAWNDCDDNDSTLLSQSEDNDCDGSLTADDCDDADPFSTLISQDGDCDGIVTADDCDDADSTSTAIADDGDCDGVYAIDDCDDTDPASTSVFIDGDCDGVMTTDDCDDADPNRRVCLTFTMTGSDQTWTVPNGVTQIYTKVWGAAGGGSDAESRQFQGGAGAYVEAELSVNPGDVLTIMIGEGGDMSLNSVGNAYPAGGRPGTRQSYSMGGGGGRSAIVHASQQLVVAGGGGGAGGTGWQSNQSTRGGRAGQTAENGLYASNSFPCGGNGASQNGPGGQMNCSWGGTIGQAGSINAGGNAGSFTGSGSNYGNCGGGGGDGYYGGGAGGTHAGGGGGSSFVDSSVASNVTFVSSVDGHSAPMSGDTDYASGIAQGSSGLPGGNGLIVISD